MALQREIWVKDIKETLLQDAAFLSMATDHSEFIAAGKVVHVPQAGASTAITMNASSFPLTATDRTDVDLTYNLDEYSTAPIRVGNVDDLQLSYNKRMSVMSGQYRALVERAGDMAAYNWAIDDITSAASGTVPSGASRTVRTSGADSATALAASATGTRKACMAVDVRKLRTILDNDNVPATDRTFLIPALMQGQLLDDPNILQAYANGFSNSVLATGVYGQLYGFNVVVRPRVAVYATAGTKKLPTAAGATTDNLGAIAFHKGSVSSALGGIFAMADSGDNGEGNPLYLGTILNTSLMHGSAKIRTDLKGIAVLVQTA